MAHISVVADDVTLDAPAMIDGLPGVGLVGKIAADHLIEHFEMTHYGNVHCDGIPRVAVYEADAAEIQTPVRLYADSERDLLVLRSDVPISPGAATEFAECFVTFFDDVDVMPIYLSGIPVEKDDDVPALYGIGTGEGPALLAEAGIDTPNEAGLVSGPTGALLSHAIESGRTTVGLVVESDPRFPDPEASRVIIKDGIEPLTGIEVPTDDLVDRAEEIRDAKERLAKRMQEAQNDSSQAQPLRMYQ